MKFDNSEPARYQRAVWKHWFDRIVGIISLVLIAAVVVRVSVRGFNPDASISTYVAFGLWMLLMLTSLYSGVRAWTRSEPNVDELVDPLKPKGNKSPSGEVMDLGHGEFDPVYFRRGALKLGVGWGLAGSAGLAVFVLVDDDVRFFGLAFAAFALLLAAFALAVIVRIDRHRSNHPNGLQTTDTQPP